MHNAFEILYVSDYITTLCRQQAQVIQTHENSYIRNMDKAKPNTENISGLNLATVKRMTVKVNEMPL
jgi:hypothetical protein